ncbi:hypothetical protein [Moritella sp. Urea-trap-13]|uniref:hypothetical protein n=1 Tax=Moritella sp. Urea-trap-13 TaxID=2058327 RepID=UPI000C333FB0|nr:hypothetical protein [Moritella sp. Urea-trap-13]PKH06219.1 hypothetical protein CXF93_09835 [Moritella sp. Urea-trap-13]
MQAVAFINEKSTLLTDNVNQFLMHKISYNVLSNLVWDVLQDWQSLDVVDEKVSNEKEQTFWFLIFELHYWGQENLENDTELRKNLYACALYLERGQELPKHCIGLRPNRLVSEENSTSMEQDIVTSR